MKRKIAYIRLDEQSEQAIAEKIALTGVNQSEAIRLIIREWAEMKKQYTTVPVVGKITQDGTVEFDPFWSTPEGMKEAAERG